MLTHLLGIVRKGFSIEFRNVRQYDVPPIRRLWLYRHGFLSSRDDIYDLPAKTPDDYLSDLQHLRTEGLNEPHAMALHNTVLFQMVLSETHADLLPTIHAVLRPDEGVTRVPDGDVDTLADLVDAVDEEPLIVKPVKYAGGTGVCLLDTDDGQIRLDGQPISDAELAEFCESEPHKMVVEYVEQADYAREIYPGSTNTIRILTMVDPETQEPFVGAAVHRFGRPQSGVVDNLSSSGLAAGIDTDTGRLSEAVVSPKGDQPTRTPEHPETGARIAGKRVPEWESIREMVLDIAEEHRGLWTYVGWDVVVTDDDGSCAVIEGNAFSDVDLLQTHQPLLKNPQTRRFFEYHGVV